MSQMNKWQIELHTEYNTFVFILLTVITGYFSGLHWQMNFEKYLREGGKAIVPQYIFYIFAFFLFFIPMTFFPLLVGFIIEFIIIFGYIPNFRFDILYNTIVIAAFVVFIVINIRMFHRAQAVLTQNGSRPLSKALAVIFGVWYYYYAVRRVNAALRQDAA